MKFGALSDLPSGDPNWREYALQLDLLKNLDAIIELTNFLTEKLPMSMQPAVGKEIVERLDSHVCQTSEHMRHLLENLHFENLKLQDEPDTAQILAFGVRMFGELSAAP